MSKMGVDEHLLFRSRLPQSVPDVQEPVRKPVSLPEDGADSLRKDLRKVASALTDLTAVFNKAHDDIAAEPTVDLSQKMDKLIEQNEEIGRAMLLLLELHREHIPKIAQNTRLSHAARLRKPSMSLFPPRK
jgi:hypothetical protein